MPKLSIITVNLNNAAGLQKTMGSVFTQTFADYEYIIIDGGSIDGSKEIIQQHKSKLVYWVSENDKGIYNAMNKGIAKAQGEYLLFLNSGDVLYSCDSLKSISKYLTKDIVYGNLSITNRDGETGKAIYPYKLSFSFFVKLSLPHQGSFIRKALFEKTGLYDEKLRICGDWKFFMDAVCKNNCSYKYVDEVIAKFKMDGLSSAEGSDQIIERERKIVLESFYKTELDFILKHGQDEIDYRPNQFARIIKKIFFFYKT